MNDLRRPKAEAEATTEGRRQKRRPRPKQKRRPEGRSRSDDPKAEAEATTEGRSKSDDRRPKQKNDSRQPNSSKPFTKDCNGDNDLRGFDFKGHHVPIVHEDEVIRAISARSRCMISSAIEPSTAGSAFDSKVAASKWVCHEDELIQTISARIALHDRLRNRTFHRRIGVDSIPKSPRPKWVCHEDELIQTISARIALHDRLRNRTFHRRIGVDSIPKSPRPKWVCHETNSSKRSTRGSRCISPAIEPSTAGSAWIRFQSHRVRNGFAMRTNSSKRSARGSRCMIASAIEPSTAGSRGFDSKVTASEMGLP